MILRLLSPTMLLVALWIAPAFAQTYTFTPQSSKDLALCFPLEDRKQQETLGGPPKPKRKRVLPRNIT